MTGWLLPNFQLFPLIMPPHPFGALNCTDIVNFFDFWALFAVFTVFSASN